MTFCVNQVYDWLVVIVLLPVDAVIVAVILVVALWRGSTVSRSRILMLRLELCEYDSRPIYYLQNLMFNFMQCVHTVVYMIEALNYNNTLTQYCLPGGRSVAQCCHSSSIVVYLRNVCLCTNLLMLQLHPKQQADQDRRKHICFNQNTRNVI